MNIKKCLLLILFTLPVSTTFAGKGKNGGDAVELNKKGEIEVIATQDNRGNIIISKKDWDKLMYCHTDQKKQQLLIAMLVFAENNAKSYAEVIHAYKERISLDKIKCDLVTSIDSE